MNTKILTTLTAAAAAAAVLTGPTKASAQDLVGDIIGGAATLAAAPFVAADVAFGGPGYAYGPGSYYYGGAYDRAGYADGPDIIGGAETLAAAPFVAADVAFGGPEYAYAPGWNYGYTGYRYRRPDYRPWDYGYADYGYPSSRYAYAQRYGYREEWRPRPHHRYRTATIERRSFRESTRMHSSKMRDK